MTAGELAVVLEQHGCRVRRRHSGGFMAQCPAHGDERHLSLAASIGRDGRQLAYCFAGCSFDAIRLALGLPHEAFDGWDPYNHQRLRSRCCRGSGTSSLTLSISGVEILNAKALLAADPTPITISVPSRARSTTTAVAADLGVLFGTADSLGVGDFPLLYVTRWAGKRLRSDPSSVARALRSLKREGSIRRGPDVVSPTGRASYTYRRAA